MYSFKNDYSEGIHPNILKRFSETNLAQQEGYGNDNYSVEAKEILRKEIDNADAEIYFISGGTQTNLIVISGLLRLYEAVISVETGHIHKSETGAIESIGHRIITVPRDDGKLRPSDIERVLELHYDDRPHNVSPKLVYISNTTELGTVYTKRELQEIYAFCQHNGLYLYIDGARLGNAIVSEGSDLTLKDIAENCDAFYIGGTKNGALFGEALVFSTPGLGADFDYILKQKGALLAKGRALGIQFMELFKNDLYFSLASHANQMALKISKAIKEMGYSFLAEPESNQVFPIISRVQAQRLGEKYNFHIWKELNEDQVAIRLITSWATEENKVNELIDDIKNVLKRG